MKYTITEATNFLRVFRLPAKFPSGYCFGGGHEVRFQLVDWFNAFSPMDEFPKEFENGDAGYLEHIEELRQFIAGKKYVQAGFVYLAVTDYGDSFLINAEQKAKALQEEMDALKNI